MEEWVNGPNGTDSCVLLGLSLWNQVCFLCEREGFYLEKSLLMTGPATGRPTVFSLCAIVCIYMLGIRCKSRSLPKGLKRSCQFVFFIIQSKVLRQTLSELFFNKNFKLFHLDIFVKISLSLKRQPANLHLVTPFSCLRVRSATLSSLPSWLDTSVALLSSSVLSIVCTHFFRPQ